MTTTHYTTETGLAKVWGEPPARRRTKCGIASSRVTRDLGRVTCKRCARAMAGFHRSWAEAWENVLQGLRDQ